MYRLQVILRWQNGSRRSSLSVPLSGKVGVTMINPILFAVWHVDGGGTAVLSKGKFVYQRPPLGSGPCCRPGQDVPLELGVRPANSFAFLANMIAAAALAGFA